MSDHGIFLRGFFGATASLGGGAVSLLAHVEQWLRISSLLVGIAAGLFSIYSIYSKLGESKKDEQPKPPTPDKPRSFITGD